MKTYAIKEQFRTVQGEGHHVGTPALFIRFAGCNMWSGREETREDDARRNLAHCPNWCDTDFVGGARQSAHDLGAWVYEQHAVPLIVLTGGEPLLQVDLRLLDVLREAAPEARIAIETNGTIHPSWLPAVPRSMPSVWITMSPKQARPAIKLPWAHEVKLVWPDYDPADWTDFDAEHFFISPRADRTIRDEQVEHEAALYIADGYRWRLSLQTHKVTRVR